MHNYLGLCTGSALVCLGAEVKADPLADVICNETLGEFPLGADVGTFVCFTDTCHLLRKFLLLF